MTFPHAWRSSTGMLACAVTACAHNVTQTPEEAADRAAVFDCQEPNGDPSSWSEVRDGVYSFKLPRGYSAAPASTRALTAHTYAAARGVIRLEEGFGIFPRGMSRLCLQIVAGHPAEVYGDAATGAYGVRWAGQAIDGRDLVMTVLPLVGNESLPVSDYLTPWTLRFPGRGS